MLHKEELHNLYSSPSILRMVKSRRVRWVVHVDLNGGESLYICIHTQMLQLI
jgi:hypothetical protein